MAYKALATKYYIKKETNFNQGAEFTDDNLVEVTEDSSLKPEISTIQRKVINCTYLNKPALSGKESGSGTLGFELIPKGNGSLDLSGSDALEVCLGNREDAGSGTGAIIRANGYPKFNATVTADSNNTGDGTLDDVTYTWENNEVTETWTVECTDDSNAGAEVWSVTGSVTGQTADATTGVEYDNSYIKFIINEGSTDFKKGDKFTIDVTSNMAYAIYEVQDGETGEAVLYKLGQPCGVDNSLAAKVVYGCDTSDSRAMIMKGIIPESVEIKIPTADIATMNFNIQASSFETEENIDVPACSITDAAVPYVGKNAKFMVDDKLKEAKDVSLTISNTIADIEAITSQGISGKTITKKEIKGSFTITFENWDELNKFKNNGFGKLYIELKTHDTDDNLHVFAVYLPRIGYTAVNVENDNGMLVNKIEFQGYIDPDLMEAIYIAHQ